MGNSELFKALSSETRIKKGLQLFVDAARMMPEVKYILIGPDKDGTGEIMRKEAPDNVVFMGGVYGKDLVDICSRAKVYVQASVHESFGCSLAEAMLCECVPVVSRNGAIPEVVGEVGEYIELLDSRSVVKSIKKALAMPAKKGIEAREYIKRKYPFEKRRDEFICLLNKIKRRDR